MASVGPVHQGCHQLFFSLVCHTYGRPLRVPLLPHQVVRTNLLGSLLATQAAMRHMAAQPGGGHIFNFEGAGSDGAPTPQVGCFWVGHLVGGGQGVQPACSGELLGAGCKLGEDLNLAHNLRVTATHPTYCDNTCLPNPPHSMRPTAPPRPPLRSCCARCRPRRPPCRARHRRQCGFTTCHVRSTTLQFFQQPCNSSSNPATQPTCSLPTAPTPQLAWY